MITVSELTHGFDGQTLFKDVNLKFTPGNCYGVIGANGAGKSTFLKLLCGIREVQSGTITMDPNVRMSVLKQDHYAFEEHTVLDTVIMGNELLYSVMKEKDELYMKADFTEEDGFRAAELEAVFAEQDGWEAESNASRLLQGLGIDQSKLYSLMSDLPEKEKVKVLLAQALFGNPGVLLLDEPTNGLDLAATEWLCDFLMDYEGTVIVVSHDRHFLNTVCTHIVDIDFGQIKMYVGNYEFWYESSQMIQNLIKNQNKKAEEKIKELENFIARFSANKSKSKQATSRRKMLEKLRPEELPASSRRYPFVGFEQEREVGKDILTLSDVCFMDGDAVLKGINLSLNKGDKVAIVTQNDMAGTALMELLAEVKQPDSGTVKWGVSTSRSYFPKDNSEFFDGVDLSILEWMRQYAKDTSETYIRGFMGRMLFSGDEIFKSVSVLSGGERVRCMLSKMMMGSSNVLLFDQVTNHLDLESITAVGKGLAAFPGNIIMVSHDYELIQTVANRIWAIEPDGTVRDYRCSYEEYVDKKLHGND